MDSHTHRTREPKVIALESVPAFAEVARGDDRNTCEDICECLKRLHYEASVVELDLAAWTQALSKRIFVVCVDTMGSLVVPPILPLTTTLARVKAFTQHVQEQVESLLRIQMSRFFRNAQFTGMDVACLYFTNHHSRRRHR